MNKWRSNPKLSYWGEFIIRTIFYNAALLLLIYLYHHKSIQGGTLIHNEF